MTDRMKPIDLRSDTVTQPSPAMREAILNAEVGDDNYGDDPALAASETDAVARVAHDANVGFHLDGARIFNAALAMETTPAALAASADSITFCLSKGLAGPVGSVICGSGEFIKGARRSR